MVSPIIGMCTYFRAQVQDPTCVCPLSCFLRYLIGIQQSLFIRTYFPFVHVQKAPVYKDVSSTRVYNHLYQVCNPYQLIMTCQRTLQVLNENPSCPSPAISTAVWYSRNRISTRKFPPVKAKLARNKSIILEPIVASSHRGCLGSPEITLQAIAFSLK
jgi:hypothetical protein